MNLLRSIGQIGVVLMLLMPLYAVGQTDIVYAEYFINDDPGFGNGIPLTITDPQNIDISFNATTDTLSSGYHRIYIRTKDANQVWSYYESRPFYVIDPTSTVTPTVPDIVEVEYFINDDPGFGNASSWPITLGQSVNILDIAQTDTLYRWGNSNPCTGQYNRSGILF